MEQAWSSRVPAVACMLLCASATQTSCDGDQTASLHLELNYLVDDEPLSGLYEMKVTVLVDGKPHAERTQEPFDARDDIALPALPRGGQLQVTVQGLDSESAEISRGEASPTLPSAGGHCCVVVCFCTLAVIEAQQCTCGSDACRPECTP